MLAHDRTSRHGQRPAFRPASSRPRYRAWLDAPAPACRPHSPAAADVGVRNAGRTKAGRELHHRTLQGASQRRLMPTSAVAPLLPFS
ncbi:hypothetical protein G6F57_020640 [Rhizopus arrhizus]|nr:hypothetical protein G6F31_017676 [Rhizopus arrhizus]KAG1246981.1 hypothetical protein G6F65_020399 [Rhizopus arrhizus]KAG1436495.1 hypothetical protein G6F57_020640 [Rhizopus arrhizus]